MSSTTKHRHNRRLRFSSEVADPSSDLSPPPTPSAPSPSTSPRRPTLSAVLIPPPRSSSCAMPVVAQLDSGPRKGKAGSNSAACMALSPWHRTCSTDPSRVSRSLAAWGGASSARPLSPMQLCR
eukprot:CAMPEP_0196232082 /NCGR_PEP_ID=MMETSP0913-20130531/2769_1 /TAXON_ID=49265 /ORGANISM="Thalassiosira rotula, Strain GSO102" /LENGTH=123 /DNA_ID=CAMNT_0041512445 /DNA_START=141 /DNA_END=508 /DNA_ORIENTATION=-